jgi:LPS sulfotransferase NodH
MNTSTESQPYGEGDVEICLDERFSQVTSSYIIASSVRTGSNLLREALCETGMAGRPEEIFCHENRSDYCRQWKLPSSVDFPTYFRKAVEHGTTANGVFGLKFHQHHLEILIRESGFRGHPDRALPTFFPRAKYIYLRRRDLRGQAISHFRAKTTNEWYRTNSLQPISVKTARNQDLQEIVRLEGVLRRRDEAWQRFFASERIEPLAMEYETLWHDYWNEIARVLAFLGQDPALAARLPESRLVRQADQTTEQWRKLLDEQFPLQG